MKTLKNNNSAGFTLIELMMVMVIIGALASIAIPQFASYTAKARAAHCLANRYNIDMDESAYFIEHDSPNLEIDDLYQCPSGGEYVWLISDANDSGYPKIGCSIHFGGSEDEEDKDKDKDEDKDKDKK
jgi:type IV pilus assembly protein PilA